MSISLLEKQKVLAPFMGSPLNYVVGQDPLGLLNTGNRTFTALLPGLNNVTERIRCYSFYAWFFHFYAQHIGKPSVQEQFKYLRRAEFILALLAAKNTQQGTAGITKAMSLYAQDQEVFHLHEGTGENSGTFENTYWKNSRGVFGQNYVSSLGQNQLALLQETSADSGVYTRSDFELANCVSGKALALAFEKNIGPAGCAVFQDAVIQGKISDEQLAVLGQTLNLKRVPQNSEEHQLLWQLLTHADYPTHHEKTYFRKRSLQLLLLSIKTSKEPLNDIGFACEAYQQKGKVAGEIDNCYFIWYYYQLEQYWHIVCTGSLALFLDLLNQEQGGAWANEQTFISTISKAIVKQLRQDVAITETTNFGTIPAGHVHEDELIAIIFERDGYRSFAALFFLLKKIAVANQDHLAALEIMSHEHGLSSDSNFITSLKELNSLTSLDLVEFVHVFIKKYVVVRHQWVSLKKMNNSQTTEKFIREDGLIRFIDDIHFGYSSPRINTVFQFFEDLQLIDSNRKLTPLGAQKLAELAP
jgi:hypothetical protein